MTTIWGTGDERGQVSAWLVKLLLSMAIVGFLAVEFGSVLINRLQASDIASQAASEASLVFFNTNNPEAAEQRAADYVEENGAEFVDAFVDRQDEEIEVTAKRTAKTFVINRIGALEGIITVTVTEAAPLRR